MNYTELFHSMHPGFFQDESIRALPRDWTFTELVMDLRNDLLDVTPPHCPNRITFSEYHGELTALRDAASYRQDGFDLSWIHYTHLAHWYIKLGYQPVLRWNSGGIFQNMTI